MHRPAITDGTDMQMGKKIKSFTGPCLAKKGQLWWKKVNF